MSGTGGDDFICGHCGHVMLEDFDPSTVRGNPVYQCGVCASNNDLHSPPMMVAIGLLGDEADQIDSGNHSVESPRGQGVREHGTFGYIDTSLATPEMNAFLRE